MFFLGLQNTAEFIHSAVYADQLKSICGNDMALVKEKETMCMSHVSIIDKCEWMKRWFNSKNGIISRVAVSICSEGILFQTSFSIIFHLKEKNIYTLPGLIEANEYISRDESSHCMFAIFLLRELIKSSIDPVDEEELWQIFQEAIDIEKRFAKNIIGDEGFMDIKLRDMEIYINHVAHNLWELCGFKKRSCTKNPFPFMNSFLAPVKNHFFESPSTTQYKRADTTIDFDC